MTVTPKNAKKREIKLAPDVKKALQGSALREVWNKLPYSHQREYHMWIEEAKKPETRARRIEQMVDRLSSQ